VLGGLAVRQRREFARWRLLGCALLRLLAFDVAPRDRRLGGRLRGGIGAQREDGCIGGHGCLPRCLIEDDSKLLLRCLIEDDSKLLLRARMKTPYLLHSVVRGIQQWSAATLPT
jgi:hypothetical protein